MGRGMASATGGRAGTGRVCRRRAPAWPPERPRYDEAMGSDCLFCRIAQGGVDAAIVYQDDGVVAFLDHRPLFPGHVLLIPRSHVGTLPELPPEEVAPLFENARILCRAVEEALAADGTFLAINNRVSQSVP